jgi:hypothetical protein
MSVFFMPIDLAISCLALAEGASIAASGAPYASNLFTKVWQMMCARQGVLVGYGLASEATAVFEKNLGRIPVRSLYYHQLVIQPMVGQLNFALDILLEVMVSAAMHKRCLISNRCWDPRSGSKNKLRRVLDNLKRTIYGRLAENGLSQLLRVNLQAVLGLLPLLEVSLFQFQYKGAGCAERVRHCCAFLVANGALRTDDRFCPDAHLLDVRLIIPFADIVPTGGNDPSMYQVFIKRQLQDVSTYSTSSQMGWKAGRPFADHLYAALIFYLLWQGPTPWEDFWPNFPVDVGPLSHDAFIAAQAERDKGERQREATAREQALLAVRTLRLYEANTNDRHPRVFLLR